MSLRKLLIPRVCDSQLGLHSLTPLQHYINQVLTGLSQVPPGENVELRQSQAASLVRVLLFHV